MTTLLHTKRAIEAALCQPVWFARTTVDVEVRTSESHNGEWSSETLACGATHLDAAEAALAVALARKRADDLDCAGDHAYERMRERDRA